MVDCQVNIITIARIRDDPQGFTAFVSAVTEHVAAKLSQSRICMGSIESKEHFLLQFVALYMAYSDSLPSMPSLEPRPPGVCRISSPWIDLVVERTPVPSVRGIVRYSERQLLTGQAMLEGVRNVPLGVAMPLTNKEFMSYAFEYARSEITSNPSAAEPIEERVPPDLLWLLRLHNI